MINLTRLGENLKHHRNKRGFTQEGLGDKIGKHFTLIGHIERGTRLPSLETFIDLCRTLKVSPNTILDRT